MATKRVEARVSDVALITVHKFLESELTTCIERKFYSDNEHFEGSIREGAGIAALGKAVGLISGLIDERARDVTLNAHQFEAVTKQLQAACTFTDENGEVQVDFDYGKLFGVANYIHGLAALDMGR